MFMKVLLLEALIHTWQKIVCFLFEIIIVAYETILVAYEIVKQPLIIYIVLVQVG